MEMEMERPSSNGISSAEAVLLGALAPGVNGPTWHVVQIVFLLLGVTLTAMLALAFSSSDFLIAGLVISLVAIGAVLFILLNGTMSTQRPSRPASSSVRLSRPWPPTLPPGHPSRRPPTHPDFWLPPNSTCQVMETNYVQ